MQDLLNKGQAVLERYKAQKIKQILKQKHKYSSKIDDYIPMNWDYKKYPLHDYSVYLNYQTNQYNNKENILEISLSKYDSGVISALEKVKECVWIVRDENHGSRLFMFYGNENDAFNKIMIKKAASIKDIPHVVNGKIDREISLAIIMKLFLSYDKHYALYLKELFEKNNINPHHQ